MDADRRTLRPVGFVPVEAKLRPPVLPQGLVRRGRLVDRLLESAGSPVVLVTAPPGYGKTLAVSRWADEDPRPFAWLSLDAGDNDPSVLLTYVLLALHRVERVDAGVLTGTDVALPRLAALLERRQPFVLVLDDVEHLTAARAVEVLHTVAEHVPEGAQLVLVGQALPPLDRERVGSRGAPLEVGLADLRLDQAEGLALVRGTGLQLPDRDVAALLERTEGWAAGTYLATLSLGGASEQPADVATVAGRDGLIAEYLRDQVLSGLDPGDRSFLVRTSILPVLCGPLCDAVLATEGSAATLERLARANILLSPVSGEAGWFRLHRLFAEALRAELQRRQPRLVKPLHARAARWYQAAGDLEEAVPQAIAAGEVNQAARLVWALAPRLLADGGRGRLEAWLDAFTPRQLGTHTMLALTAAWCALQGGRPAEPWVLAAERGHYDAARKGESQSVAAATALLRAATARHGLEQMAADAELAARLQEPDDPWLATARLLSAVAAQLAGDSLEGRARLEEVEALAAQTGSHEVRAVALGQLALMALDEQDLAGAEVHAARALAVMRAHGVVDAAPLVPVHCLTGLLAARQGRREEAAAQVQRCVRAVALTPPPAPWAGAQCRLLLARTELLLGDPPAARTLLSEAQALLAEVPDATALEAAVERTWRDLERIPLEVGGAASTLTTAELRVLQYLPTHLSFEEIGRELFVSRNTVKTQAVAAYRKLGVSSRGAAVERAGALGLIAP